LTHLSTMKENILTEYNPTITFEQEDLQRPEFVSPLLGIDHPHVHALYRKTAGLNIAKQQTKNVSKLSERHASCFSL